MKPARQSIHVRFHSNFECTPEGTRKRTPWSGTDIPASNVRPPGRGTDHYNTTCVFRVGRLHHKEHPFCLPVVYCQSNYSFTTNIDMSAFITVDPPSQLEDAHEWSLCPPFASSTLLSEPLPQAMEENDNDRWAAIASQNNGDISE
jgi:hypothetical protein